MTNSRLSVIIPHWNAKAYLPTCLAALQAQTHPDVEVIVVDNGSEDGSQALIREQYPDVILIELGENRGFTGACNAGIQAASGPYIALLNNDTEVMPGWAAALIAGFEAFPDAGFLASRMMLFDQRDHFHAAGDFFRVDGMPGNRGVWQRDEGQYDQPEYVFSACGGASAYRRAMLEEIGSLDDTFFFSGEDIDLAWRAQLAGYRCVYIPNAVVYHMLSATGGGVTASYYIGRNLLFILIKNYPLALWQKYGWHILKTQVRLMLQALQAWRGAAARARLRGMASALPYVPRLLYKRRIIQYRRVVSLAYIESILTPLSGE